MKAGTGKCIADPAVALYFLLEASITLLLLARNRTVDASGAVARVLSYTLNTHATSDLAPSSPHNRFDVVLSYNLLHDLVRTVSSHREPETQTAHNVTEADQSAGLDRRITWSRA